jgi:hypothetical protein
VNPGGSEAKVTTACDDNGLRIPVSNGAAKSGAVGDSLAAFVASLTADQRAALARMLVSAAD